MDVTIIGSGIASKNAAETLLSGFQDHDSLTLVTRDESFFYSRVFLPDYIAGELSREELLLGGAEDLDWGRARFAAGRVTFIDTKGKSLRLENGTSMRYDKLIIASGASPHRLKVRNADLGGIFYLRDLADAEAIKEQAQRAERCIVVGGGLVSLKAACALNSLGKRVTVLVGSDLLLSLVADRAASEIVRRTLEAEGIRFRFNSEVKEFAGDAGRVTRALLQDGSTVEGEMAVIAKGVRPNTDFVRGTDIETDKGILVNERMETTAGDVYAAGDVAQSADLLRNGRALFTLWPDAAAQGRVAACGILGREQRYCGGLSMNSVVFYSRPFVFLGLVRERDIAGCEVHSRLSPTSDTYRKVVIRNNRLVGAILAGNIDFAGMLYWDIRSGREVEDPRSYLSLEGLSQLSISKEGSCSSCRSLSP
jgi:nitrite reductase (NADH) large subunit